MSYSVPSVVTVGQDVDFKHDQRYNGVDSAKWDFGDGNTSTHTMERHNYSDVGKYNTSVEITKGGDTATDSHSIQVVEILLTGPDRTEDGTDSGQFKVTVQPASVTPSAWQWTFEAPDGAGNNPNVDFASPSSDTTTVTKAHWFALPDDRRDASRESTYQLNCEVTVDSHTLEAQSLSWTVFLGGTIGSTGRPHVTGSPRILPRKVPTIGRQTRT